MQTLVDRYRPLAARLKLVTTYGPIGGWILGPILALIGITVLFLGSRAGDDWDSQWDDDDEDEDDEADSAHPVGA